MRKDMNASFYYNKNNLIEYYNYVIKDFSLQVVPLYDYVKNKYELVISHSLYNLSRHHEVCVVRTPNNQLYLINVRNKQVTIANINKGTVVYNLSMDATYLFHSMPIGNSFVLFVMRKGKEIVINVIDLIKEKKYVQKYPLEKIMETIVSLSKKYYECLKELRNVNGRLLLKKLDGWANVENSINNSITNLVFTINV
jgi:hypothetical protein